MRSTAKKLAYAFTAQAISLTFSLMASLILPKLIGVSEFGFVQLFMFYASYAGFFHFGVNDGIYLINGGKAPEELDNRGVGSQLSASFVFQTLISLVTCAFVAQASFDSPERKTVLLASIALMPFANLISLTGSIFQAIGQTDRFSASVIIEKVSAIVLTAALLVVRSQRYELYIAVQIASKALSLAFCLARGRAFVFVKRIRMPLLADGLARSVKAGLPLTLSNVAASLILGSGRFFMDKQWGIQSFSKLSVAISLTYFFLLFIGQIGMVLFPILRSAGAEKRESFFTMGDNAIGALFTGLLLFYWPLSALLITWLPQYRDSAYYLAFLMPICIFDGKMQLLGFTYLKVLRKERILLGINMASLLLAATLTAASVFILRSVQAALVSMVVPLAFRSIVIDAYISKIMKLRQSPSVLYELGLVAVFMTMTIAFGPAPGFAAYSAAYAIYIFLMRKPLERAFKAFSGSMRLRTPPPTT